MANSEYLKNKHVKLLYRVLQDKGKPVKTIPTSNSLIDFWEINGRTIIVNLMKDGGYHLYGRITDQELQAYIN